MKKHSIAPVLPVAALESTPYLVRDGSHSAAAVAEIISSRPAPSKVVHVAFGEWPVPTLDHPDSLGIREFVAALEGEGYGNALSKGRKEISSWMDSRTTLRSLRLSVGLSQEQLASIMGTSQPQIARMESGRQDLQLSTMRRLAEALNVSIHNIVDAANG